jgi:hypothetical protein
VVRRKADLQPEQYAYRRGKNGAHDAINATHSLIELMLCLARRIVDRHVLHLIKMWLKAPVEEDDGKGNRTRSNPGRKTKRGIPQGSPISPLLSNLYMRRFVLGWKKLCAARH